METTQKSGKDQVTVSVSASPGFELRWLRKAGGAFVAPGDARAYLSINQYPHVLQFRAVTTKGHGDWQDVAIAKL